MKERTDHQEVQEERDQTEQREIVDQKDQTDPLEHQVVEEV